MLSIRKRVGLFAVLLLLLVACAPAYNVRTTTDSVYGTSLVTQTGNALAGGCIYCGNFELNIIKYTPTSGIPTFGLSLDYRSENGWFFIEDGPSLTLRVDGTLMTFTTVGRPDRNVGYAGAVHESAWYDIGLTELRRLANASEILVRIQGSSGYANREFSPENFANFKRFLEENTTTSSTP